MIIENTELNRKIIQKMIDEYNNDPSRWTQFILFRDKDGNPASCTKDQKVCWCLSEMYSKVLREHFPNIYNTNYSLNEGIWKWLNSFAHLQKPSCYINNSEIVNFNDSKERTFPEIIKFLEDAIKCERVEVA